MCASGAMAQDHDHTHDAAHLGDVNFPVSCKPQAQQKFNTAAAYYYSFYWEKIDSAVAEVLAADPKCAMAHWLKAIATLNNALGAPPTPEQEKEGRAAIAKAKQLRAKTPRERDYIQAAELIFKDSEKVPFPQRAKAHTQALEQLHLRYPKDSEAAVLYALWLQVSADRNDQTYAQQLKSGQILEKIFDQQPNHPGVVHFIIHAYAFPPIAQHGFECRTCLVTARVVVGNRRSTEAQ
jgi:hypothetical protein